VNGPVTRALLAVRDQRLRRCHFCGCWAYHHDPCHGCGTAERHHDLKDAA
jgi:hypothetical protein